MKKRVLALLLATAMVFALFACGKKEETKPSDDSTPVEEDTIESEPEPLDDGWELNTVHHETEMEEEDAARFVKAMEGVDGTYAPIALLATQVVAGVNYAYLAYGNANAEAEERYLFLATIYEDTEGYLSILELKGLETATLLAAFDEEPAEKNDVPVVGGWTIQEKLGGVILAGNSIVAFNEAMKNAEKEYAPLAFVASQVVAGTNYLVIATEKTGDAKELALLKIYEPVDGSEVTFTAAPWDFTK